MVSVDVEHHVFLRYGRVRVWELCESRGGRHGTLLVAVMGLWFDTASALLSLQKGCGLWTLSCDFVHHFLLKH